MSAPFLPAHSRMHWAVLALSLATAPLLLSLTLLITPDPRGFGTHEQLGLPPCRSIDWFGIPCPGCGITTSISHLLHGDLRTSLTTQPFGLIATLLLAAFAAWGPVAAVAGRDLGRDLSRLRIGPWGAALGALLAASWAYKIVVVLGS
jgi:hypothetical protein